MDILILFGTLLSTLFLMLVLVALVIAEPVPMLSMLALVFTLTALSLRRRGAN